MATREQLRLVHNGKVHHKSWTRALFYGIPGLAERYLHMLQIKVKKGTAMDLVTRMREVHKNCYIGWPDLYRMALRREALKEKVGYG